ncbi:hypothetical protein Q3G72_002519 [Acer saccharum]|nr:hypothetical protein Q3G72_002519 [Acer saccharum]
MNNSSIQADVSSNEVVEGIPRKSQPFRRRHILDGYSIEAVANVSSWGEDDIRDINKFFEWADDFYLKEMGKLRKMYALRDSFTKPDPTYERVLKLQKEKQILSEYPHLREPLHFALAYLDPSLRAQVLEKGLLQLLGGWRSSLLRRYNLRSSQRQPMCKDLCNCFDASCLGSREVHIFLLFSMITCLSPYRAGKALD